MKPMMFNELIMNKIDIYNPTYLMPETIMVIFQSSLIKRLTELPVINAVCLPNGHKVCTMPDLCKIGTTYPKSFL